MFNQSQQQSEYFKPMLGKDKAKIVQFADENKTLPDGSKVIYAENEEKIVLYHKKNFEKGTVYVYERKSGKIFVNGQEGSVKEKRSMIALGTYMLGNCKESDMVTVTYYNDGLSGLKAKRITDLNAGNMDS